MLKIAIAEDDDGFAAELMKNLERICSEKGLAASVTRFSDGAELTEQYRPGWDIIFMDIEMPQVNGMEAAGYIRRLDESVIIIFVTTMAQYAIKGYEVNALDFVLKPVSYIQLKSRFEKALKLIDRDQGGFLIVTTDEGKKKLPTGEILYIEVRNHTLDVVTKAGTYSMRGSLAETERALDGCHFSKCNQCYLVNLKNVDTVKKDSVMVGGRELPFSRPRKRPFLEELSEYLGVAL